MTATTLIIVTSVAGIHNVCHGQAMPTEDQQRSWQMGVFFAGGAPPNYTLTNSYDHMSADLQLQMYSLGFEVGRTVWGAHGKGILQGQMEMRAEAIPIWVAHYPSQTVTIRYGDGSQASAAWKGQNFFGASVTPLSARWNFNSKASSRYVPWVQIGAGVLWTNHKFPITMWASPASTFNFTPQVGAGLCVRQHSKRSIEVGVKVVHISNAGIGDSNPGINQTIVGSIGYSWWR
jgi:hypothetical protein